MKIDGIGQRCILILFLQLSCAFAQDTTVRFDLDQIPSPQRIGQYFDVVVQAKRADGLVDESFTGTVDLECTANSSGRLVAVDPVVSDSFVLGVWTGSVRVLEVVDSVKLYAAASSLNKHHNAAAVLAFQPVGPNLLENGSFEMGLGAAPIYPAWAWHGGWLTRAAAPEDAPLKPTIVNTESVDGNYCLKMGNHTGVFSKYLYLYFMNPTGLIHGDTYRISYSIKMDEGDGNSQWERKSFNYRHGSGFPRLIINGNTTTNFTAYIDNIMWAKDDGTLNDYEMSGPIEIVLMPGDNRTDGIHYQGTPYDLAWKVRGSYAGTLDYYLYQIDLSRKNRVVEYKLGSPPLNGGVVEQVKSLAGLKIGSYQLLIAAVDSASNEIVAVGKQYFSVLADLNEKAPPQDFIMGSYGGIRNYSTSIEYVWRGYWDTDEFYKLCYETGYRLHRYGPGTGWGIFNAIGDYEWSRDNEVLIGRQHDVYTMYLWPQIKPHRIITKARYNQLQNTPDEDISGYDWYDKYGEIIDEDTTTYTVVPNSNTLAAAATALGERYGDAIKVIEYRNESKMLDLQDYIAAPIYPAYKAASPDTSLVFNGRTQATGSSLVCDGYDYHPYQAPMLGRNGIGGMLKTIAGIDQQSEGADKKMGCSELHYQNKHVTRGYGYPQRFLLDWAAGSSWSLINVMGEGFREEAAGRRYFNGARIGSFTPGLGAVALNGIYNVLEGCKRRLHRKSWTRISNDPDWYEDTTLIAMFERDPAQYDYPYVLALIGAEWIETPWSYHPDRQAHIVADLNGLDLKAYDGYGEPMEVPDPLILVNMPIYIACTSDELFTRFENAKHEWANAFADNPRDRSYLSRFNAPWYLSRTSSSSSSYTGHDFNQIPLVGKKTLPTYANNMIAAYSGLQGSGDYIKATTHLSIEESLAREDISLSWENSEDISVFLNGELLFHGSDDKALGEDWSKITLIDIKRLNLLEVFIKPLSGNTALFRMTNQSSATEEPAVINRNIAPGVTVLATSGASDPNHFLIDFNWLSAWRGAAQMHATLGFLDNKPHVVNSYTLKTNAFSGWTLSGSNDGINWIELDRQTGMNTKNILTLNFENTQAYSMYKFATTPENTNRFMYQIQLKYRK